MFNENNYLQKMIKTFEVFAKGVFGKKNIGAAVAYVKALSLGLAGARVGTPVPFTRKARRRKFRKGLYTRAGYHRQYVGGGR